MDRDAAVTRIRGRLGQRVGTALQTQIIDELDSAQDTLEKKPRLPWFILSEDRFVNTSANEERLRVPSGFLREHEAGALWHYDATAEFPWKQLTKKPADMLRASLGDSLEKTGPPEFYALSGIYFRLAPVPDAAYTIYTKVYIAAPKPSTFSVGTETNAWLTYAPEMLITEALVVLARHLMYEDRVVARFDQQRIMAEANFWRDIEAREHANMQYEMGV